MAQYYMDLWGAWKDRTTPLGVPMFGAGAQERVIMDKIDLAGVAAGSTLLFGPLPEGCVVTDATIYQSGLGAGVTLKLGTDLDDDLIQLQFDAAAAGFNRGVTNPDGFLYQAPKLRCLKITVGGGAATGEVRVAIKYAHN